MYLSAGLRTDASRRRQRRPLSMPDQRRVAVVGIDFDIDLTRRAVAAARRDENYFTPIR
jgi:hypothetical protein